VLESESSTSLDEVSTGSSGLVRLIQLNGFIVNSDDTVTSILSNNLDFEWLGWDSSDGSLLFECNLTGLIVIDDSYSSSGVFTCKLLIGVSVEKLDEEISIWLPVVVIVNFDINLVLGFSLFEFENLINTFIISTSFGLLINCLNTNFTSVTAFVVKVNHNRS